MDQLEKVKTGLECCAIGAECDHCPYSQMNDGNGDFTGCHQLHWDALELLKEQQPKKGKWQPYKHGDDTWHQCSACGVADRYINIVKRNGYQDYRMVSKRNFCPNCGADMRGEQE